MAEHELSKAQADRINAFLAKHNASIDTISKRLLGQLVLVDNAVQARLYKSAQARSNLRSSSVNIKTISEDTGISNKTFYNNELLGKFVESFAADKEKTASAAELTAAKERIAELEQIVEDMINRDINDGKLLHENEMLNNTIKQNRTHISNLERQLAEARLAASRTEPGKVIAFPTAAKAAAPVTPTKRIGTDPDTFNLGIAHGSTDNFLDALKTAKDCGTHTVMLYCDNEYFETPTASALKGFNIVIHGPLNINLASEDKGIRDSSVKRMRAIIRKCNTFGSYIKAFVIHPGSCDNNRMLIDSLTELLQDARFPLSLETMAGKGRELCSTLEEMHDLCERFKDYDNFTVCIDTCHMSDAGYRIADGDQFIKDLTTAIPLSKISCIHLNDSQNHAGSRKDRHAEIGKGCIPLLGLRKIATYEYFYDIPKVIETPQNPETNELTFPTEMKRLLASE